MVAPASRWWVSLLLGFLAVSLAFLTIAYLGWLRAGPTGTWYGFGIAMFALNAAATLGAGLAYARDARTGELPRVWWISLLLIAILSYLLYPQMGRWAPPY